MPFLQRLVLLEGEWIDRTHDVELALEHVDPATRIDAVRQLRARRRHGDVGSEIMVGSKAVDGCLQACPELGLLDLGLRHHRSQTLQLFLGLASTTTQVIETLRDLLRGL